MTKTEINEILEKHKLWLEDKAGGIRADLKNTNLEEANLSFANLEEANLEGANLIGANLKSANLGGASLEEANLSCANLEGASLSCANLKGASLSFANLEEANLICANLEGASLSYASLSFTNLICANLEEANLRGANLIRANLRGVVGNNKEVKTLHLGKYHTTILVGVKVHIGCREHSIEEWENFTDEEIENMDDGALEWWKDWKEIIMKIGKGE